jgi:hypothetical protein
MKDEALKLALEALLINCGGNTEGIGKEAITAIKQALALDKKAENARELGLDYEPVREDWGPGPHEVHSLPPAAPVQEPVAWRYDLKQTGSFAGVSTEYSRIKLKIGENWTPLYTTPPAAAVQEGRDWSLLEATQESLREHIAEIKRLKEAQPAVPDAIIEAGESPDYRDGWNDCRQTMLEILKARGNT